MADDLTFAAAMSGSRIELSDGSIWRVAPQMFDRLRGWAPGSPVAIQPQPQNLLWPQRLANLADGSWVSIIPSANLSDRPFG